MPGSVGIVQDEKHRWASVPNVPFLARIVVQVTVAGVCRFTRVWGSPPPADAYPPDADVAMDAPPCQQDYAFRLVRAGGGAFAVSVVAERPRVASSLAQWNPLALTADENVTVTIAYAYGRGGLCRAEARRTFLAKAYPGVALYDALPQFCPGEPDGVAWLMCYNCQRRDRIAVAVDGHPHNLSPTSTAAPSASSACTPATTPSRYRALGGECTRTATVEIAPKRAFAAQAFFSCTSARCDYVSGGPGAEFAHLDPRMAEGAVRAAVAGDSVAVKPGDVVRFAVAYPEANPAQGRTCRQPLVVEAPPEEPLRRLGGHHEAEDAAVAASPGFGVFTLTMPDGAARSSRRRRCGPAAVAARRLHGGAAGDGPALLRRAGDAARAAACAAGAPGPGRGQGSGLCGRLPGLRPAGGRGRGAGRLRDVLAQQQRRSHGVSARRGGADAAGRADGVHPRGGGEPDVCAVSRRDGLPYWTRSFDAALVADAQYEIVARIKSAGEDAARAALRKAGGRRKVRGPRGRRHGKGRGPRRRGKVRWSRRRGNVMGPRRRGEGRDRRDGGSYILVVQSVPPVAVQCITPVQPTLANTLDGTVGVVVRGGVPPYYVRWADEPGFVEVAGNVSLRSGVGAGLYLAAVVDSSATASVTQTENCYAVLEAAGGSEAFEIVGVSVGTAEGCGAAAIPLNVTLAGVCAETPVTAGVWDDNGSVPILTCGDGRLVPAAQPLALFVAPGTWGVAVCAGGRLATAAGIAVAPQPALAAASVSGATVCLDGYVAVLIVPPVVALSAVYEPLQAWAYPGGDAVAVAVRDNASGNGSVAVLNTTAGAVWLRDARGCRILLTLSEPGLLPYFPPVFAAFAPTPGPSPSCEITAATDPALAPAIIEACVAAGMPVTGVGAQPVVLPVFLGPYPMAPPRSRYPRCSGWSAARWRCCRTCRSATSP